MSKAILYDATLCIGCKSCERACAERNHLPYTVAIAAEGMQSAHKLTVILTHSDKFMRRLCMNCLDPTCASVCPVAALRKTSDGPVVYDESRCIGCRYCMMACPFGVPKYEWNSVLPRVRKCDMCADRLAAGQQTACAEACPTGATKFGERDALIAEARDRMAKNPGQYVRPHLRIVGSGRNFGSSAVEHSGHRVRLSRHTEQRVDAVPHLSSALAHSGHHHRRRRPSWRYLVDQEPKHRSGCRRGTRGEEAKEAIRASG